MRVRAMVSAARCAMCVLICIYLFVFIRVHIHPFSLSVSPHAQVVRVRRGNSLSLTCCALIAT